MGSLVKQLEDANREFASVRIEVDVSRRKADKEFAIAKDIARAEVMTALKNWLESTDVNSEHKANLKEVWQQAVKNHERLQDMALKKEELFQHRENRVYERLKVLEAQLSNPST